MVNGVYFMTEGLVPWSLLACGCLLRVAPHHVLGGGVFLVAFFGIFTVAAVVKVAITSVAVSPTIAGVKLAGEVA